MKFKEFRTSLDNVGTKYLDQDLLFENNKNKTLVAKTSVVNVNRGITPIKNQISQNRIILVILIRLIRLHKIIIYLVSTQEVVLLEVILLEVILFIQDLVIL